MRDKLYQILEAVYQEQKTGTIHLFGRAENGKQLYHVITVEGGQVCYIGRASRPEAVSVKALLGLEVTGVQFTPNRRNWLAEGTLPDIPSIVAQIKLLGTNGRSTPNNSTPIHVAARQSQPPASTNLRLEAVSVLQKLYGKNAYSLVAEISQQFPPEQVPQQFVDGCVQQAAHAIGSEMAEDMFKHLR